MSMQMAWDELGLENYGLSVSQKSEETMYDAMIQAKAKEIMMKPDLQAQMMQQQMAQAQQMQAQQQAQQQGPAQTQFSGQQGFDTRAGGAPAAMPGQGREQLTGQAASGQGIA